MNGLEKIINIQNIRGYVDDKGTVWLNLEDVSRGLGFTRIANSNNVVVRWERVEKYLKEINERIAFPVTHYDVPTCGHDMSNARIPDYIPENVFYMLAMKARNQVAYNFQQRIANEILPMIRKTGMYMTDEMNTFLMNNPNMINQIVKEYNRIKEENDALNAYAREKDGQINELWDRLSEYEDIDDDEDY